MNVVSVKKNYRRVLGRTTIAAAALLALSLPTVGLTTQAHAAGDSQSALLKILIRKGILTQAEADQIQQEAATEEQQQQEQQKEKAAATDHSKGLKIEALGYLDYSAGKKGVAGNTQNSYNEFNLTRGYLTVQKAITPWLGARVTTDITRDNGSWDTRIKYLYAELKPGNFGFLTGTKIELGQGHIPWLDFEEHINPYRCQDNMAIEKAGVFNSADLGASLQGSFGGTLADAKTLTGNSHYAGRYGSWHVGIYNGGGYHAGENNQNKVLEGRFSMRPLPDSLPGLQLSYFGATGKGNVAAEPDYSVNLGMLSYEHPDFILTGQYFKTTGNAGGNWVHGSNKSLETAGTSFFGAYHLPVLDKKLSAFARWDHFDADDNHDVAHDATYDLYIGGLSYNLYKGNMVVLDYEAANYGKDSGGIGKTPVVNNNLGDDSRVQLVYQFQF